MSTEYQTSFLNTDFIGKNILWLNVLRQNALTTFLTQGLPGRQEENWKYTDLKNLQPPNFLSPKKLSQNALPLSLQNINAYNLVFFNGHFCSELSSVISEQGVTVTALSNVLQSEDTNLAVWLETQKLDAQLLQLNTAFLTDGLYLKLEKNTVLSKPIRLLYITDDSCMYHPRNIFCLKANSQATIFEEHLASNPAACYFKNSVTQIQLDPNAILKIYKLQNENLASWHIANTFVQQQKDSQFFSHSFSLGSKLNREDLNVELLAQGATCQLQGLYVPHDTQHIDHHTRIDHHHSHTHSNEYYKGILRDQAKAVFNGKVIVHPNAQKIQSQQHNKNLLLSANAEVNTKPELEIYADDVQCAHGATVGQLDPEALFYLRARGISVIEATHILVEAFAEELLTAIEHKEISTYIHRLVKNKTLPC